MANIKGIIVEIGGDTSGLQKALSKVNSSTASLSKELKGVNSLLKLDPKNTELVSQKQQILKESIEQTSKKLEELKKAQEMADDTIANGGKISQENYRNLQREIINTQNKLNNLKAEASNWTKAGRSIEEFGNKVTNISNKIDKIGTTLTTNLTLPIVGLTTTAIASMNAVDEGLDTIATKTGATGSAAKELQQIYKEVASEVPGEFGDIGAAIGEINTRLDLTGDKLKTASVDFLKFAKVNGVDVNTSVQLVTRAMGDAGIEADKYSELLDMLTVAGQKSGISIESLTTNLAKYGAPMRALGIDTKNAIAMFAGWEKAGVNTEIAFSGMKKAISNWGAAGKDSTKEFSKTLKEIEKCPTIAKATTKAIEVFGAKAGPDLADAIKGGRFEFQKYIDALDSGTGTIESTYSQIVDEVDDAQLAMQNAKIAMHDAGEVAAKSLGPILLDLSKQFKGLMERFDKLSDKEKKQILNMGLMVASIGPAIKIIGKLSNTVGTGIKTVGSFSQAISLMGKTSTEAFKNASAGTQTLAKALTLLTSPAGLATTGITLLTVSLVAVEKSISKNVEKVKELKENIEENIQARKELKAEQDKQITNNLAEINNTQSLYEELKTITDENGNIKKGYEKRANFIVGQLNSALGTEIGINGNVIESYKQIQEEIDKTILKKKAEIYLQTQEENYKKALESRADTYEKLSELQDELTEAQNRLNEAQEKMNNSGGISKVIATDEYRAAQAEIKNLNQAISEQNELISDYSKDVNLYNDNIQLMAEGTTESLNKVIENSTKKMTEQKVTLKGTVYEQISTLQDSINKQKSLHTIALNNQDETNEKAYQNQIEADEKQLIELGKQLAQMTSSIETLSPEQIEAWRKLSQSSQTAFNESIKYLPTDVQNKLKEVLNITENSTIPDNFGTLANISESSFDTNLSNISEDTDNLLTTVSNKMKNDTSVKEGTENLAKEAEKGFNDNVDGSKWGSDLTEEISTSMTTKESKNSIVSAASKVAGWIADFLHFTLPDKGPLSDMDESMPDMIEIMTRGIDENKSKLVSSASKMARDLDNALTNRINIPQIEDFGKIQGNLSSQIVDSTKTIFTTPQIVFNVQELDEGKLQQCFNYVNKKFGSKY